MGYQNGESDALKSHNIAVYLFFLHINLYPDLAILEHPLIALVINYPSTA